MRNKSGLAISSFLLLFVSVLAADKPDLRPYKPGGWTAPIVVTKVSGSTSDSSPLFDTDTLYVSWAIINSGTAPTSGQFWVTLYLDEVLFNQWFYVNPMVNGHYGYLNDVLIGKLKPGSHTLRTVIDSTNTQNELDETNNQYSKAITILRAVNHAPAADAGPDRSVTSGQPVTLAGAGSDPDTDPLSFSWTQTQGPAVTLTGQNAATASFVAPSVTVATVLTFTLTVSDGQATDSDSASVTVNPPVNHPPTVSAGADQTVTEGALVSLTGTASDLDGDPVALLWTQTGTNPLIPVVTLQNQTSATASFQAPAVSASTALHFRLQASDGKGGSDVDDVVVTVTPEPETQTAVMAPVALFSPSLQPAAEGSPFEGTFVGVALVNTVALANAVDLSIRDSDGRETEQKSLEPIPPKGQRAAVTSELVTEGSQGETILASGQQGPLQGFFMGGDHRGKKLDGVGGLLVAAKKLFFPVVDVTASKATRLVVFNPDQSKDATVTLKLKKSDGSLLHELIQTVKPQGSLSGEIAGLFPIAEAPAGTFLQMDSTEPVMGFTFVGDEQAFSAMIGQIPKADTKLYAPHFFVAPTGGSLLRLLNTASGKATVTVRARRDDGSLLGSGVVEIESGRLFVGDLAPVLGIDVASLGPAETISGYLELDITTLSLVIPVRNGIVGSLTFGGNQGRYASTLPLMGEAFDLTALLHLAQSEVFRLFTGLAVLNPSDSAATLEIKVYDINGAITGTKNVSLPGHQRRVDLMNGSAWLGPSFSQVGGHVEIRSSLPVFTFALFGSLDLSYLSAIEAQPGRE